LDHSSSPTAYAALLADLIEHFARGTRTAARYIIQALANGRHRRERNVERLGLLMTGTLEKTPEI